MVKNYKAKISKVSQLTAETFGLRISLNNGDIFTFEPGQFVNILVAPSTRRSYSIGSSPVHNDYIDLYADVIFGGPGSLFFQNAKVGQEVELLGPLGSFVYKDDPRPAYFFSTGTGIVPFMSMLSYALETLKTKRQLVLYQGFRYSKDVFAHEFFTSLAAKYPNFTYKMTLSKPEPVWTGLRGRITEYYLADLKTIDKNICASICGSKNVITDVQTKLNQIGVPAGQIYFEQFY